MLNQISIMGRLTRDPELKTTPAGKSVCTITQGLRHLMFDVKNAG